MDTATTQTALVLSQPAPLPTIRPCAQDLLGAFFARRSQRTREAYESDLRALALHLGVRHVAGVVEVLRGLLGPEANALGLGWRAAMVERQLAPNTVNRRLSSLRSITHLMRTVGAIPWTLDVEGERASRLRDTRGPAEKGVQALLRAARAQRDPWKVARDVALVRLLHDLALRRQEVVTLDLVHVDLAGEPPGVLVQGKGETSRERLSLPDATRTALGEWIAQRGNFPGPLFLAGDRRRRRYGVVQRLTGEGVRLVLATLSARALLPRVRPHGLRHAAITTALDATSGDLRRVQRFSRHADVRTLQVYDDNRADLGGEVACLVAERLV